MVRSRTRRSGCLAVFFVSAWRCATKLFATGHLFTGDEDDTMDRIYAVRGIIGLVLIIGVTLRYHGIKAVGHQANQWADITERTVLVIALVLGVGLVLALAWTKPTYWWTQVKQFRWPLLAIGGFFAVCYAFVIITRVANPKNHFHYQNGLMTMCAAFAYLITVLWILIFVPRALYLLAGGWCRAADAHPFLAPLVSTVVTWYLAAASLLHGIGADGTPQKIALAVTLERRSGSRQAASW